MSLQNNPYTLFLVLVLLLLGMDTRAEPKLNAVRNLIDQTAKSLAMFNEGYKTMETGMEQVRVMLARDN